MPAMTKETDLLLSIILDKLIEVQSFNLTNLVLLEIKILNMLIKDMLKIWDLHKDLKFMERIFQNNLILRKFQLPQTQDLDLQLLPTLFKKQFNKNLLDNQKFQIKVSWDFKILWFQIKRFTKLWVPNQFHN
jgi:hypothetical protein